MKVLNMGFSDGEGMPTFAELYPDLVDPQKLLVYDGFVGHPNGPLRPLALPLANSGQAWTLGTATTSFQVQGGEVSSSANAYIGTPCNADGKVYAAIRWGVAASFAGLLVRLVDINDWGARVSLSSSSGGQIRIEERSAGGTIGLIKVVNYPLVIGSVYLLSVDFSGTGFTVRVNGAVVTTFVASSHLTATGVGLSAGNPAHKYLEFAAGI